MSLLKRSNVTNKMLKILCEKLVYFYAKVLCMIWQTLRYLITFFLPSFYKRIQAKNLKNVQVNGPVIIAMNHPNAFTDPIYFCYVYYPWKSFFLARGDAFKPGLISYLLEAMGVVPIFRMQDAGKEGLKKNDESYQRVNYLLRKGSKIIVFAEGLCVQERRLRPLKKGVARMVFGAYEALNSDKLVVVPIGVNYSKPHRFRSNVFYNVGEPIPVKDFIPEYTQNPAKTYNTFLQVLEPKMRALITHIEDRQNDELVYQVEELCKKDELMSQGLDYTNLEHDFRVLTRLTEKVNAAARTNPELIAELKPLSRSYFKELEQSKLKDWLINPKQNKNVTWPVFTVRLMLLVMGAPIYVGALVGNYFPFILAHMLTKKNIKNIEFYSSIAIGSGMFLFWINYILWFTVIYTFSPSVLWPFCMCFLFALSAWFSLYYHPFMKKTFGMARILKNKPLALKLGRDREKLLSLINKF